MPTYGKVKVQTLTYDSSGSAVDLAVGDIASKASPTFTGTINGATAVLTGRLLIGTTTEGHTPGDNLTIEDSTDCGITIRSGTSNSGLLYFSDGTSGADEYRGFIQYTHGSTNNLYLGSNGTTALTLDSSQNATFAGTVSDSKGELRTIVQTVKSAQHTIVAADSGKHSINSTGGWIINTSTGFTAGQAITLINNSGSDQTVTNTGCTMYLAGDTSTKSSLTLKGRGMATFICTASNVYYGSGAGLE